MIPLNNARLAAAFKLLADFRAAGHVTPTEAATGGGHHHASPAAAPHGARPPADKQRSPVGWPVTRDALAAQIESRLKGASLPYQSNTSYCGDAAFLVALQVDRPDLYAAYAIGLWTQALFTFPGRSHAALT